MSVKGLVVGVVGAGCIAAAGLGGYLAARGGSANPAAAAADLTAPDRAAQSVAERAPGSAKAETLSVPASKPSPAERRVPSVQRSRPASNREAGTPAPVVRPAERATAAPTVAPASNVPTEEPVATVTDPEPARPVSSTEEPAATPAPAPEPPRPAFEEVTVAENGVIGISLDTPLSSETAKIEDRVSARVSRDVTVEGRVAVPAGSTLEGVVTAVERGGRFRERARLGIQFTSVVLADDTRIAVQTEPIYRLGEAPGGEATAKIGAGAVIGSILGAVIGGKKGAALGGTAGAAGGTATVMASGANHVTLVSGTPLTVRLTESASFRVPIEP